MILDDLHILATPKSAEVLLNSGGIISIKGRAIEENTAIVNNQVMEWIDTYLLNPAELTEITIALEYLSSSNLKSLTSALKKITRVIQRKRKLVIHWYYEENDDDILWRGKCISSIINFPIEFIMTKNITNL